MVNVWQDLRRVILENLRGHCGSIESGYKDITNTSDPHYCAQFSRSCIDGPPSDCPSPHCYCDKRADGIIQTFYFCKKSS
ncbi:hypothetical protein MRX96_027456 [Rhipicephalus microplus]